MNEAKIPVQELVDQRGEGGLFSKWGLLSGQYGITIAWYLYIGPRCYGRCRQEKGVLLDRAAARKRKQRDFEAA
jgi:hypothetical protein